MNNLKQLSVEELTMVNGGGLGWYIGYAAHGVACFGVGIWDGISGGDHQDSCGC